MHLGGARSWCVGPWVSAADAHTPTAIAGQHLEFQLIQVHLLDLLLHALYVGGAVVLSHVV